MSAEEKSASAASFGLGDAAEPGGKSNPETRFADDGQEPEKERLHRLSEEINLRFAPRLEQTALLLYDLDPERLQAQWHVTSDDFAQACGCFPESSAGLTLVLQLCRLSLNGEAEVVDRAVTLAGESTLQGQQRFAPEQVDAQYLCELGLASGDGGWVMLVRSNPVRLAGAGFRPTEPEPVRASAQVESTDRGVSTAPNDSEDLHVEAALAADGEPLNPMFPNPWEAGEKGNEASPEVIRTQATRPWVTSEGAVQGVTPVYDLPDMPAPLLPSSAGTQPFAADGSPTLYDPRAALSSAALRRAERDQADLEVHAELVVQGRALPGSLVDLFGLKVRVGGDGRFAVRHPVADPLVLSLALGANPMAKPADPDKE